MDMSRVTEYFFDLDIRLDGERERARVWPPYSVERVVYRLELPYNLHLW